MNQLGSELHSNVVGSRETERGGANGCVTGTLATIVDPVAVLAWGRPRLRDLPWRRTREPWAILVAEVMLQQTQGPRVISYWERFLTRWPSPAQMAAAPLGDVLREWQGLGYPRRARNLHHAARCVADEHRGEVPLDLAALLDLPGVGGYTARAVLAFAGEHDVGVVDTNIARVLARTAGKRLTPKPAQTAADAWVPTGHGWEWNQILMDLGAELCRPVPRCAECPLSRSCAWQVAGRPEPDPAVGSAGVSGKQARFEGSERQRRGRLLAAAAAGPVAVIDHEAATVASLVADGLVVTDGAYVRLP